VKELLQRKVILFFDITVKLTSQQWRDQTISKYEQLFKTVAPTNVAPTNAAPTNIALTTVAPTSVAPTNVAPTNVDPTSDAPTTVAPTAVAPTSVAPTNVAPTTYSTTYTAPSTAAPTTAAPTTAAPTTAIDVDRLFGCLAAIEFENLKESGGKNKSTPRGTEEAQKCGKRSSKLFMDKKEAFDAPNKQEQQHKHNGLVKSFQPFSIFKSTVRLRTTDDGNTNSCQQSSQKHFVELDHKEQESDKVQTKSVKSLSKMANSQNPFDQRPFGQAGGAEYPALATQGDQSPLLTDLTDAGNTNSCQQSSHCETEYIEDCSKPDFTLDGQRIEHSKHQHKGAAEVEETDELDNKEQGSYKVQTKTEKALSKIVFKKHFPIGKHHLKSLASSKDIQDKLTNLQTMKKQLRKLRDDQSETDSISSLDSPKKRALDFSIDQQSKIIQEKIQESKVQQHVSVLCQHNAGEQSINGQLGTSEAIFPNDQKKQDNQNTKGNFYCKVCGVISTSAKLFQKHLNNSSHKKKAGVTARSDTDSEEIIILKSREPEESEKEKEEEHANEAFKKRRVVKMKRRKTNSDNRNIKDRVHCTDCSLPIDNFLDHLSEHHPDLLLPCKVCSQKRYNPFLCHTWHQLKEHLQHVHNKELENLDLPFYSEVRV